MIIADDRNIVGKKDGFEDLGDGLYVPSSDLENKKKKEKEEPENDGGDK